MSEGGTPLRALVTVLGLDQHEAGSLAVARLLRDAGLEVVYPGRFQLPETTFEIAVQEAVDVVGVSAHSWEFLHFAGELAERLHSSAPPIPVVVGGSVVTEADRTEILDAGIDEAVLPTATPEDVIEVFRRLGEQSRSAR